MHPLDAPAWGALHGVHQRFRDGGADAAAVRYQTDVAPFCALEPTDTAAPAGWEALRELVGAGGTAAIFGGVDRAPDGWVEEARLPTLQLMAPPTTSGTVPEVAVEVLGPDDAAEAMALVGRTRPGPFLRRTIELGTYLGVRHEGVLVAMAGQRMQPPGHVELSAVCTDAAHRGRGLAGALVARLVADAWAADVVPYLHVLESNTTAVSRYLSLGFTRRTLLEVLLLRAPR